MNYFTYIGRMKKMLLTVNVLLFCLIVNSQEKIHYLSNKQLDNKIIRLGEDKKYDSIITVLAKISPNDSIYDTRLVTKSYYLMQMKRYKEALAVVDEGLVRNKMSNRHSFYINKYVCYRELQDDDSALKTLEEAISEYPMNSDFHYRKGMIYYNNDLNKDALACFKRALKINPFDANTHLGIGNICLKQHLSAQALMCFNMYLLLNPEGEGAFSVLNSLNDVLSKDNTQEKIEGFIVSKDDAAFEDMNMVLDGKISLSKKYKIKNPIDISFTRQNQIFMEMLNDYEGNDGLWSKKYIEFYKWVYKNNHFDNFIYTTTYSIKNKEYKAIVDKKIKDINKFVGLFNDKWQEIMTINSWDSSDKIQSTYFHDKKFQGYGEIVNDQLVGKWEFYDSEGKHLSHGTYDDNGNKIGAWEWKYNTGITKEVAHYKKGKLYGENKEFFENGKVKYIAHYKNDSLQGNYKLYNNKGSLIQDKNFKKGLLEGSYNSFHKVGKLTPKYKIEFEKGEQNGVFTEQNAEGTLVFTALKVNGGVQGDEELFYDSGIVKSVSNYKEGEFEGSSKSFYKNGILESEGVGVKGSYQGERKIYYPDGVLKEIENYNHGELHGVSSVFAPSGKIYYEFTYRKGELIGYTYYNTSGGILKEAKKKGGEFYYEGYSKDGNLTTQGLYDVKGGKEGEWKFYYTNGGLSSKGTYKSGLAEGIHKDYHINGQLQSKTYYKQDVQTGYAEYYNKKGFVSSHGWILDGEKDKIWRNYYLDGTTLNNEFFYHKGQFHGAQKYFSVEGKLIKTAVYDYGEIISEELYGYDGEVVGLIDYTGLERDHKIIFHHQNGKIKVEYNFTNGVLHGDYITYNYYGNIKCKGFYVNGNASGKWIWLYDNGKIRTEMNFIEGEKHGEMKRFYRDGANNYSIVYNLGTKVSIKYYSDEGNYVTGVKNFLNGKIHGKWYSYSESGKLQLIRFFEYDRLIGYSYHDKNDKELAMIPIKNETAKIISYFNNGKKARELEYRYGELVNQYSQYYYSGKLFKNNRFTSDNYEGESLTYYTDGVVKSRKMYQNGDFAGLQQYYYANGKLKKEANYKNDAKSGAVKYYDENGKLVKIENYFDGEIYSIEE